MNVAVFCPNWIGDVVMATPALHALRAHFARDRIIGVVKPYVAEVLQGSPWLDEVFFTNCATWEQGVWGTAQRLRRAGIDLAILFPNSFRSALTAWLGGARRRVGYARGGRGLLLTDRLQNARGADGRFVPSPIIDDYNRLAEHVGCPRPDYRLRLFVTAANESAAERVWSKHGLDRQPLVVGFNNGGAFGAAKHWPASHFAELARLLVDRHRAAVLVLCGPSERELARAIVAEAKRPGVVSLADEEVSIGLLKACVRRLDLLVTTDSGPRHFAAAFDRPVVTLFGPTHVQWTETHFAKAVHLQKVVDCGPCQLRTCPLDHRCMRSLAPAEVHEAVATLLVRHARPAEGRGLWHWLAARRDRERRAS